MPSMRVTVATRSFTWLTRSMPWRTARDTYSGNRAAPAEVAKKALHRVGAGTADFDVKALQLALESVQPFQGVPRYCSERSSSSSTASRGMFCWAIITVRW